MDRLAGILAVMLLGCALLGCNGASNNGGGGGGGGDMNSNGGGADGGGDDGGGGGGGDDGGSGGGLADLPFASIHGTETMVEGLRTEEDDGSSTRRDERFTADWSLTPTSAVVSQAFIGDELVDVISGDLQGTAHLTYEESGNEFSAGLDCGTENYGGDVEWDVDVTGDYEYVPALQEMRIDAFAATPSSPEYLVSFTFPGCPEFDSQSPVAYVWPGPGQGAWGFVTIVLRNGSFTDRVENPFADDRGAEDYYEISVNGSAP